MVAILKTRTDVMASHAFVCLNGLSNGAPQAITTSDAFCSSRPAGSRQSAGPQVHSPIAHAVLREGVTT